MAFMLGCELQFPIKEKFFIETGLNLRYGPTTYTYWMYTDDPTADFIPFNDFDKDGNYIGDNHVDARVYQHSNIFLHIPLRFCYRLHLKGDNEFQFALGPYFETILTMQK